MTFQTTVMTIAIGALIVSLAFIGMQFYRQKYTADYPPVIPNCPDYWDISGNICKPHPSLGNGASGCNAPKDFTTGTWAGQFGKCAKYKWAKGCNLTWDGLTTNPDTCTS